MALTDFDPAIVSPILNAIRTAFSVQLSTDAQLQSFKPKDIAEKIEADIASVISLTSPTFNGTLAILFPSKTFLGLVELMLSEKHEKITPDNVDAAAEILNIIYGVARPEINKSGFSFAPALLSVIHGQEIKISHPNVQLIGVIQCQCHSGPFQMELSLKKVG